MANTIGKNSNPSMSPSKTKARRSLRNSLATKPNSLAASMEAASAAAIAPWTTGASADSSARLARRRLQPIAVTKPCRRQDLLLLDLLLFFIHFSSWVRFRNK